MIQIGSFQSQDHTSVSRRAFVQTALSIPAAFSLGATNISGAEETTAPAKSIVLLWLWGGPSHIDTFDPKPKAASEIRGPFSTIATQTPGLRFTELFPLLAQRSNLFSVVRSNFNHNNIHRIAGSIALTGKPGENGDDHYGPNFGSVIQKTQRGTGDLPPFISVTQGPMQTSLGVLKGYGGGKWGKSYDPFAVKCDDQGHIDLPALKLLDGLQPGRLNNRQDLLASLNQANQTLEKYASTGWDNNFQRASRLLGSKEGTRAFDLSLESEETKGKYGRTTFGQSCLLARRLVEAQVPYIQVNWSQYVESLYGSLTDFGWDTHRLNFEYLADRHGPILDRAVSAFLDDLHQRGLLDSTLVVCLGEFGRTPKVSSSGGRDHWPRCYCSLWAGGGIQPGRVVGTSDERGYDTITEPITPDRVGATILSQAGLGTEQRAELRVLAESLAIEELL